MNAVALYTFFFSVRSVVWYSDLSCLNDLKTKKKIKKQKVKTKKIKKLL